MGSTKHNTGNSEPESGWRMQEMVNPFKRIRASTKEAV